MTRITNINQFNPSGIGIKNNNFIGLPFNEENANVILLPVPWDVTTSYAEGTASGPSNILNASYQLDLYVPEISNAWKLGIYMRPFNEEKFKENKELRKLAKKYIDFIEHGGLSKDNPEMSGILERINDASEKLNQWVYHESLNILENDKMLGIIGGDHSVPFGYLNALTEKYEKFGVLQIDAHMDLRNAYEGFKYSHASIFNNALQIPNITKLVQVGIRDCCEEEVSFVKNSKKRVEVYFDYHLKEALYDGMIWRKITEEIVSKLPELVYVSFDIDGLSPNLCPNTGTPVPGGLQYNEAIYLIKTLVNSGRKIIGFDLSEVAGTGNEWDGNVGARVTYELCNWMGKSKFL